MHRELAGGDEDQDLLETDDGAVRLIQRAARDDAAGRDGEAHGAEQRPVVGIERQLMKTERRRGGLLAPGEGVGILAHGVGHRVLELESAVFGGAGSFTPRYQPERFARGWEGVDVADLAAMASIFIASGFGSIAPNRRS